MTTGTPAAPTRRSLTTLTEAQRATAMARFALLRPAIEDGVPVAQVAQAHGIHRRTAQRWLRRYRELGLAGLVHQPRADRGRRRRVAADLQQVIEGLALRKPPPSIAAVHRRVTALAAERGWPVPSYGTVYSIIRALDPALVTLAHEGAKAHAERYDLIFRREATRPNEIWQADHSVLDLWLLDERGQPAKPWLTIIEDDHSRAIAGYFLGFQPSTAFQTALTLRGAIWRKGDPRWPICGIPEVFYTDHGGDFTSSHLEHVAADLHMQAIFSGQGRPRGRGKIERFFQTVDQLLLCELPGYAPAGGGVPPQRATLTLPAFEARFRAWLLEDYHRRVHSETGMAPVARWEAGGFLPRLPESLEQLDLLLLTVATPRRVHQDGIRFKGMRFLDTTLAAYVGEDVVIRYDPRDMAEIRVFHGDRFLCRAVCQELADQTISLKELVQARRQRRHHLREELAARNQAVALLLEVHQPAPSPEPAAAEPARPRLKRYFND